MAQHELKITIANLNDAKGKLMIAVYKDKEHFLTPHTYSSLEISVNNLPIQECKISLLFGQYAISIYHDINEDGELNSNFLGIPTEPTGFSNNKKMFLGRPKFDHARFEFDAQNNEQIIFLNK